MNLHHTFRVAAVAAVLVVAALVGSQAGVAVSQAADDFTLQPTTGGKAVQLSGLKGEPALVVFWATWCPPCRREIPVLKDIATKYQPKGLHVLAIAINYRQSREQVIQFQKENQLPYTVLWDSDNQVADHYGVSGIPTVLFVDPQGVIRYRANGVNDDLMGLIEKYASKK